MTTKTEFFKIIFPNTGKPETYEDHVTAGIIHMYAAGKRKYDMWVPVKGGTYKWTVEGDVTFYPCQSA